MTESPKQVRKIGRRDRCFLTAISLVTFLLLFQAPVSHAEATFSLSYSARLTGLSGAPLEGPLTVKATFWDSVSAGLQLGPTVVVDSVPLTNGTFTVDLPLSGSQIGDVFGDGTRTVFIEITAGEKTYPRQMYSFVPLALRIPIDDKNLKFNPSGRLTLAVGKKPNANAFLTQDSDGALSWGSPSTAAGTAIGDQDIAAGAAISQSKIAGLGASLAGKEAAIAAGTSSQYYRGDKTWQELSTAAVTESGTSLYYNDARARSALTGSGPINYSIISGTIGIEQASGLASGYLSSADWSTFAGKQNTLGYSPLNKGGDTMSGDLDMGFADIKDAGNISMAASKTLLLSNNASDPTGLTASDKGKTWFNSATNEIKYWDGNGTKALGIAGSGLVNLNGITSTTQTFATPGTAGTAPIWSSSGSAHTLNIPLASASGVTAGLIGNTDYNTFHNKVGAVTAGTGLAVNNTSGTATVSLNDTSVTAGSYDRANITVDGQGRLTAAQSAPAIVDADISSSAAIAQSKISGLSTSLGAKEDAIAVGTNSQYFRGDKSWQSLTTTVVTEGSNLYYSDARSRAAFTSSAPITYSIVSGTIGITLATSSANGYLSSADWATFNGKQDSLGYSPLNKAGDTMSGALYMNSADITNAGNIGMAAAKTLLLSNNSVDPTGLATGDKGRTWFNSATNEIKFWDGTNAKALGIAGSGLQSLNGLSTNSQTFATPGTSGTAPAWSSSGSGHTLNIPLASAASVVAGLVSNTDYNSFVNKISSVTAGTGLTGGGSSGAVTLNADVGTTANKLVQLDATAKLPAVDGSALTSLTPANLASAVPVAKGGTGLTSGIAGGIPYFSATNAITSTAALTSNGVLLGGGSGAPTATPAGAANSVLRVPSAGGAPSFGAIDLAQNAAVSGQLGVANGGTGASSTTANYVFAGPNGATGAPSFRALAAADYPAMVGANGTNPGTRGAAPAPSATDNVKFLRGDGTWQTPPANAAGASNQIQFNSGGALSGSSTFVYDGSNVGIGTVSPSTPLQVNSGSYAMPSTTGTSQPGAFLRLQSNGVTTMDMGFATNGSGWIQSTQTTNLANNYPLLLNPNGGNVGIGTTAPTSLLNIRPVTNVNSLFWSGISDPTALQFAAVNDANNAYVPLEINASQTNFRNGNVGIGTTAPGYGLDVNSLGAAFGTGAGAATLYLRDVANASWALGTGGYQLGFYNNNGGTYASKMVITNVGNVGIGTSSPSAKLEVSGQFVTTLPSSLTPTSTAQTIDWSLGNIQTINLSSATGNVTLTFTNALAGAALAVKVVQGATAYNIVWPSTVKWPNGTAPTISTTSGAMDLVTFFYDGTYYFGAAGQNYR